MRSEHERLADCLSDLARKGRPIGAKTKPMPPKEGPLWQAFVEWFSHCALPADRRADMWRAFCAGAEAEMRATTEGR